MKTRDVSELMLLGALWGSSFLFMRMAVPEMGPLAAMGVRVALAALMLLALLRWRGGTHELRWRARQWLFLGVVNSALPFALLAYALLSVTAGFAAILNATAALWAPLVAWVWLRQRLPAARAAGLALGFLGVVVLVWGQVSFKPGGSGLAVLAGLAATFSYGVAVNYSKRQFQGVGSLAVATGSQLGAAVALLPLALWAWPAQAVSLAAWASLGVLALACTALAYILYFRLVVRLGASGAITVTYLVPVFAMAWGGLFLGERPTLQMLLGGAVVLVGVALSTGWLGERRA